MQDKVLKFYIYTLNSLIIKVRIFGPTLSKLVSLSETLA
jgi:hypothetical protein